MGVDKPNILQNICQAFGATEYVRQEEDKPIPVPIRFGVRNKMCNLGLYSWCRIQGKRRKGPPSNADDEEDTRSRTQDLIVVSAYRPCGPGTGINTVWAQQRDYLLSKGRDVDPRAAFVEDILASIEEWTSWGCEVILGIDANEDLSLQGDLTIRSKFAEAGLREAILQRHPDSPPATQIDNTRCEPIDGIFVTSGVEVIAGGYYEFYQFLDTDHRGLWIDIDLPKTLGGFSPKKRVPAKRLNVRNRSARRRYIKLAESKYNQLQIGPRLLDLHKAVQSQHGCISPQQEVEYNLLHAEARLARVEAEKGCRKLRGGGMPWSPKGQILRDRIQLWRILVDRLKGKRVSSRKLRRLLAKTKLKDSYKLPGDEVRKQLSDDLCLKRKLKANNTLDKWRKDFLVTKKSEVTKAFKRSKSRYNRERHERFRRMQQREETRRRRKAQGRGFSGGLRMIQVERQFADGSTRLVTCSDQRLVEEGCMQENRERYDQTRFPYPTPPMKFPLYQEFTGPLAEEYVDQLLDGSWEAPSSLRKPTQAFLRQCRSPVEAVDLTVDRSSNNAFWRRQAEMKGSEPHGPHNSHYKAATFSPLLSSCDALFRDIPLRTGMSPSAWKNLMNFAIEKKAGDFRVKKMRTIQLMDAEFQANNKLVGKQAMRIAEAHHLIPPGQCGSRKKHQAIDLAVSKQLVWDQLLLKRQAAGWILNDAKSCFDRVVHWVAQVALRRFGIPWSTVDMMFKTLRTSTHRVRTGFGDSSRRFVPPSSIPFQGCGQGNGAGPTIWVAISSILIDTMQAAGHGYEFLSVLDWCLNVAECFCFVDDTDLVEAAVSPEFQGDFLVMQVQSALSLWSECVLSTGGAINPEKSFWWMIDFKWDSRVGKWRFRSKEEIEGTLWIKGLRGLPEKLTRLAPDETEKTLGIMMSPKFQPRDQKKAVTEKARRWASTIKKGSLLPYDVFPLLKTTILKSLEYPMPLMHLSRNEWESIMKPVLKVALPKARISWRFPREVVYGPQKYQGLGIPHPLGTQISRHIDMLLRHPANRSTTGRFLEACLQSHQLETGTSYGLLQQDYSNTAILTSETWLKRNWCEFEGYGIHIEFDSPAIPLRCVNDSLLVDSFIEAEVDQETLKWLDWCRMFLNVSTLSDIVTADGTRINDFAWNGKPAPFARSNVPSWPRAAPLTSYRWRQWRQTLTEIFLRDETSKLLRSPLGPWHDDIFMWNWVFSPSRRRIFCRQGHGWLKCRRVPVSHRSPRNDSEDYYAMPFFDGFYPFFLPDDVQRVTVRFISPDDEEASPLLVDHPLRPDVRFFLRITGVGVQADEVANEKTSILDYWQEFKDQCDGHYGWTPDSIEIEGSEERLLQALAEGNIRIISDGSYKDGVGTSATQIRSISGSDVIWIVAQVPGLFDDQSAYRSELIGLLAGIQVSTWLRDRLGVGYLSKFCPKVVFACDGKAALEQSFDTWPIKSTARQFDVISSIREAVRNSFIDWCPKHVKGHQDELLPNGKLSWWALRNIECDARAKSFRCRLVSEGLDEAPNLRFFTEPAALYIDSVKQSRLVPDRIMEKVTLPPLLAYWRRRNRLSDEAVTEINWARVEKMMKSLPSGLQRWTTKHAVGMCGVGKWKYRWRFSSVNQCPRCGEPEDHLHVPRCRSPEACTEWDERVANFHTWLRANDTAPEIQASLLRFLGAIRDPPESLARLCSTILSDDLPLLRRAIQSQIIIGVQCLLEGLLSHHWATIQSAHFAAKGSRRSGEIWYQQVAAQLIWIGFHMWQHRNGIQHSENNVQFNQRHQEVNLAVREQFELGYVGLPSHVQAQLRCPRLEVLRQPLDTKELWVRNMRRERRIARTSLRRQQALMRSFFTPLSSRSRSTRRFRQPQGPLSFRQPSLTFTTIRRSSELRRRRHYRRRPPNPTLRQSTLDRVFGVH